jgi:hypothetical protein
VRKVVFAQAIGGIFFSIFGGQPMSKSFGLLTLYSKLSVILLTTVPLAIYIKGTKEFI